MTRYFQSTVHLLNYLRKAVKESGMKYESLIPLEFCAEVTSRADLMDTLGWKVRENPLILEEGSFWEWYRKASCSSTYTLPPSYEVDTTPEFRECLESLERLPGVYSFWRRSKIILYVGMSINLGHRVFGSFIRFKNYHQTLYFRYFLTDTASDAAIFETYLIAKLKPAMNGTSKFDDEPTFDLTTPRWSAPIKCQVVKGQKG